MKNFIEQGDTLVIAAPSGGVASGDPVLSGAAFGVAQDTAAEGADVVLKMSGVFTLPKATGASWSKGDPLYWDASAKKLTKTAANNLQVAVAWDAAASGDATGSAKINEAGAKLTGLTAPQAAIAALSGLSGSANNVLQAVATAVTGVDGTGSNAASKADVDDRLTKIEANFLDLQDKINAMIAALGGANIVTDN